MRMQAQGYFTFQTPLVMKILLLGSGGRENALAWKIAQSPLTTQLFIAPGNPGTAALGTNVNLDLSDFDEVAAFAIDEEIQTLVVGPEVPLVEGIADYFAHHSLLKDICVIGPQKAGAQLEGSKDFAKAFMQRHHIPTARYATFTAATLNDARAFLNTLTPPYVLKADGLAAGKGVVIVPTLAEAESELDAMLGGKFGKAGAKVVIEEFMQGTECSVFVITDGRHYALLPEAKDYKRIGEKDTGLNTGGMGSVSPVPFADEAWIERVRTYIIEPTIKGLQAENIPYQGFIFFGLINTVEGPKVIEYNCRMGDPETESVMLRLQTDLVEIFEAIRQGRLNEIQVEFTKEAAACVMLVSGGYPEAYEKNKPITLPNDDNLVVFHAGTREEQGRLLSNGGRVVAVCSRGATPRIALDNALKGATETTFEGAYYRRDIGSDIYPL